MVAAYETDLAAYDNNESHLLLPHWCFPPTPAPHDAPPDVTVGEGHVINCPTLALAQIQLAGSVYVHGQIIVGISCSASKSAN
jgi:hypothetical protein